MRRILHVILVLFSHCTFSQLLVSDLLREMMNRPDQLLDYTTIDIDWTMKGHIQADLNDGINNLIDEKNLVAVGSFDRVLAADPQVWQAVYYRGICYKRLWQPSPAIRDFERLYELRPDFYEGLLEFGKVLMMANKSIDAEEYLHKCVRLHPERVDAYFQLGLLSFRRNDLSKAEKYFQTALEKNHEFYDARIALASVAVLSQNRIAASLAYLNDVLAKDSANVDALVMRSIVTGASNPKSSLDDITRAIGRSPSAPGLHYIRGLLLVETDNYQAAYNEFKQVVRRTEVDERKFTGQQTGIDQRIDIQNAIDYVVANIYAIREKDAARVKKGFCELLIGRQYQAIETIRRVPFHQRSALCLYLMGLAYEHQDWHEQAWASYGAAVKIDPDIADAHKKIGIYCSNTENWLEAEREFSEALRLSPRNTVVYNLRGVVRFNMADYHNAIADFSAVLAADTANFSTFYNRMETYAILKDSAGVSRDRTKLLAIRESIYQHLQAMVDDLTEAQDVNSALAYLYRYHLENPYVAAPQILMLRMLRKHDNWKQIEHLRLTDEPASKIFYFEDEHAYILVCKGLSYLRINNKRTAEELFTQAIKIDPHCSEAYLERGRMYIIGDNLQVEKRTAAITDLKKSASLGNDEAKAVLEIVVRTGTMQE